MILVPVTRSELQRAHDWHAGVEASGQGRNLFRGKGWVGWLGERALEQALRDAGVPVLRHGGLDGKPDLEVAGRSVGVKTTEKRNLCLVPDAHVDHAWDWWFFCGWREKQQLVELRGAIRPAAFRSCARHFAAGSEAWVRYPCHAVKVADLRDPEAWIRAAATV